MHVTLVFLPLKYEIDDSVTVTTVLLGEAGLDILKELSFRGV